jgi:succinyl-CoA synthetase alpha subunit
MAIFVDQNTKVIVQGLTGGQGRYHGLRNKAYGTQVVGGVTPGKAGQDVELVSLYASPKVFPHKTKHVCLQHCSATTQQHGCLAQTAQALSAQENATSASLPVKLHKYQPRQGQTLASFHDREHLHIRRCTN